VTGGKIWAQGVEFDMEDVMSKNYLWLFIALLVTAEAARAGVQSASLLTRYPSFQEAQNLQNGGVKALLLSVIGFPNQQDLQNMNGFTGQKQLIITLSMPLPSGASTAIALLNSFPGPITLLFNNYPSQLDVTTLNQLTTQQTVKYFFFTFRHPNQTDSQFLKQLTRTTTIVTAAQYPSNSDIVFINSTASIKYIEVVSGLPTTTNASILNQVTVPMSVFVASGTPPNSGQFPALKQALNKTNIQIFLGSIYSQFDVINGARLVLETP
jgi:hypothetical protein